MSKAKQESSKSEKPLSKNSQAGKFNNRESSRTFSNSIKGESRAKIVSEKGRTIPKPGKK
jgi:hypothetical protein